MSLECSSRGDYLALGCSVIKRCHGIDRAPIPATQSRSVLCHFDYVSIEYNGAESSSCELKRSSAEPYNNISSRDQPPLPASAGPSKRIVETVQGLAALHVTHDWTLGYPKLFENPLRRPHGAWRRGQASIILPQMYLPINRRGYQYVSFIRY